MALCFFYLIGNSFGISLLNKTLPRTEKLLELFGKYDIISFLTVEKVKNSENPFE